MLDVKIIVDERITGISRVADTLRVRVCVRIHIHERMDTNID
jgi:hypothetical protein